MKKNIYYFCTLLFAIVALQSCENDFDYIIEGEENLVGNKIIKKMTNTENGLSIDFQVENGKLQGCTSTDGKWDYEIIYGNNEKIKKVNHIQAEDNFNFLYNSENQLISITGENHINTSHLSSSTIQFFDGFNLFVYDNTVDVTAVFEYDNSNRLVKSIANFTFHILNSELADSQFTTTTTTYNYTSNNHFESITSVIEQGFTGGTYNQDNPDSGMTTTLNMTNFVYDNAIATATNVPLEWIYGIETVINGEMFWEDSNENNSSQEIETYSKLPFTLNNNIVSFDSSTEVIQMGQTYLVDIAGLNSYTYDSDGYPSSVSSSQSNASTTTYEYQPYNP